MKLNLRGLVPNIKNNIILILLIVGGIFNDLALRAMTIGDVVYWKPIVTSIPMIIFASILALFLSYKNRNYIYITLSIYFGVLNGMNYMYYKHYNSFLSFSLLKQLSQVREMGDSVLKTLDPRVLIFAIPTVILIITIIRLNKANFFEKIESKRSKIEFVTPLVIGIAILYFVSTTLTGTDKSRIIKQWNRPYLVEQLGIYSYTTADFVKNLASNNHKISEEETEEVSVVLEDLVDGNLNTETVNEYSDIFKGRDIYVIHYESAQAFAMDQEFEDGPVTPFLNKMASEGLYFNNFYPQHSVGTSSDTEFTFNTSLLPINNGTVFMTHANREYVSLQKLLKQEGYYSMSMHGNNGDFWNRNMMHKTLGYDRFFSKNDYVIDEEIGLGLSDKSFFRQSIEKIKETKEQQNSPVISTLITLTNHYPFDDVDKYGEFNVGHLEGTDIGNYLKSFHYADEALQTFIEGMDQEGLLDNAIVVLYGDHHAKISKSDYEKVYNYDETTEDYYNEEDPQYTAINGVYKEQLKRTPFIIWSKDKKINETINTPMGMVDALPTLSNMLGILNPYQLGVDMMSVKENTVVFPDGDWLNSNHYYSASSSKLYSFNNDEVIEDPDLIATNHMIDEKIELSNNIIQNDLIRFFNGLLAQNKVLTPEQRSIMYTEPNI
ncbi:LTA synthase family protein [Clostridium sp. D2Q-11]|uniref:LTA synthase family protein n=1 Tax=Anaeromonas frigoriresistens TaxID=2683708 RepID=A0A942UV16_9FIRM|nr:LTA synthase family protein [Anaeromonas frigoriresistens]MBS4538530.1 LTA synthase family protein [Anaeromonas frigoriresistens]